MYSMLFHIHIDFLRSKSIWVDWVIGRLPAIAVFLIITNYGINLVINYVVNEIVKVQTMVSCKP